MQNIATSLESLTEFESKVSLGGGDDEEVAEDGSVAAEDGNA